MKSDFLSHTMEARRNCQHIFQVLKEKNATILYMVKISVWNKGVISQMKEN